MKPKVIAVVGPTASGKTSLGIFLAQKFRGEVVSADSRQVYKGLNLGTGKVTKKEMLGIPHHLLDVASPGKEFSAETYVRLAEKACSSILQKNKIPMIVGGTGFYIDALVGRIVLPNVPPNETLRAKLEMKSCEDLFAMLKKLDPRRAATIEPEHKRRLIRAIEIAKAIGKSPEPKTEERYEVLWLGLAPEMKKLQKSIHVRLIERMQAGMLAEGKRLHAQGLSYKRMEALGLEYRSLSRLLQKKVAQEEFLLELERAINHYAKRQLRWFKRNSDIRWVKNKTEATKLAKEFLDGGR